MRGGQGAWAPAQASPVAPDLVRSAPAAAPAAAVAAPVTNDAEVAALRARADELERSLNEVRELLLTMKPAVPAEESTAAQ